MFKLLTDPTVYPIREVPLQRSDGRTAIVGVQDAGGMNDILYPRPDGRSNVIHRDRKTLLELAVQGIDYAQYQDLQELAGLSAFGRTRTKVWAGLGFDRHTWFSAPLTGSLACYRRDDPAGVLEKINLTHTRASVQDIVDEQGNVVSLASGEAGFVPSVVGKGLYIGNDLDQNVFAVPHPSSGSLGWATLGAAPITWDSYRSSRYQAAGGSLRFDLPASSIVSDSSVYVADTASGTTGDYYHFAVDVSGRGRVQIQIAFAGSPVVTSEWVDLTEEWQTLSVSAQQVTASAAYTAYVRLETLAALDQVLYVGPAGLYRRGASSVVGNVPAWQAAGSRAADAVSVSGAVPPFGGTFAVCGLLPDKTLSGGRLFYLPHISAGFWPSSGSNQYVYTIVDGESAQIYDNGNWAPGQPFVYVARVRSSGVVSLSLATGGAIYEKDSTTLPTTSSNPNLSNLTLSTSTSVNQSSRLIAPQFYRFDGRVWSDAEVKSYARFFEYEHLRGLIARTSGRQFVLRDASLEPIHGRTAEYSGTITLEEVDIDPDFAVLA